MAEASTSSKKTTVKETVKRLKEKLGGNLNKLEKAFLVEVDKTSENVKVCVNKVAKVKEKVRGADIKDIFQGVDLESSPDKALDQAWAVVRNNVAWLSSGGSDTFTGIPYLTDAKLYRPSSIIVKSSRDYKPKVSTFINIFTDDPTQRRFWKVLPSLSDCATEDTKQYTRCEVVSTVPISPVVSYEHWNDKGNTLSKVVEVKVTEACQTVIRHPDIQKVRLNWEVPGLNEKELTRLYILQEIITAQSLEVKVTVTNQKTGEHESRECLFKAGDPDMPHGVPVAFSCDKFKVNKDGSIGKQQESNPCSCRNGIFEKR